MIYAGTIDFGDFPVSQKNLIKTIETFSQEKANIFQINNLTLCYGKLSHAQDMDEVWENKTSCVIGRIFDKEKAKSFNKTTFKKFPHLLTEEVLNKFWGKYIYIHTHDAVSEFEIVIDSTGQLPFFYYIFPDGSLVFASDIEILFKILAQKPEYNWPYLCSYLLYGSSSTNQTPFKNVFELPPTYRLKITKDEKKISPFWDPLKSYKKPGIFKKNAVDVLQETLKSWIEPYETVCVSLSGGLDSSSIVYCLKDIVKMNQKLIALNYFHSQIQASNELVHAKKICEEVGIDLIEVDASQSLPFSPCQGKQKLNPNKPFAGLVSLNWQEVIMNNVVSKKSVAFISGHGSDHIFMRPPSPKSIADYILENGFKGCKQQFDNIAYFYRDTIFSIFKSNFKSLIKYVFGLWKEKNSHKEKTKDIPRWIKKEAIRTRSSSFSHSIYNHFSRKSLPGKYDQIDSLYEGIASIHVEMMQQADPTFYPFLYEPVVEFAISFPTYALFKDGYDRYPLRKDVADKFKTDTVWRRDKSQTTGLFQLGVKHNLNHVLDLCLNGHFVKKGFIDKESLEKTIHLISHGDCRHFWAFINLASVELFLRYWDTEVAHD